jgi:hypothetical protein
MPEREAARAVRHGDEGQLGSGLSAVIAATISAAQGWKLSMLFTFDGLTLLKKAPDPGLTGLGNRAMPIAEWAGAASYLAAAETCALNLSMQHALTGAGREVSNAGL